MKEETEFKNQIELFTHIANTREWVSEVSGKRLYDNSHPNYFWQFSHLLSKGAFPAFKLNPDNICLMLPSEHLFYEHFVASDRKSMMYKQYAEAWNALFEKKERLKQEYHSIKLV